MINRFNAAHRRVLVVEDEQSIAQLLMLLLKTRGYSVEVALTGTQAIQQLQNDFDIVILDLVLPGHEGFRICEQIRSRSNTRHLPIIVISSKNGHEDRLESLLWGADDYLNKPFDPEELFSRMEAVLYRRDLHILEKEKGEGHQFDMIRELRRIVDEERVNPYFQPIYDLRSGGVYGLEVLSRPQTDSILSNPEILFKEALKYGLYFDVEMVGWRKAIRAFREEFRINKEFLFLNCNPYLVESEQFNTITAIFQEYGLALVKVYLEITERSAIAEHDVFFNRLKQYRDNGFKIAVDDVGGGYSSLESIVQTHPEVVKIDRHIVSGLNGDPFKRSIVKLIVAFCKENGIISVAEGIETKDELDLLKELGVNTGQGYYLCRPKETIAGCLL